MSFPALVTMEQGLRHRASRSGSLVRQRQSCRHVCVECKARQHERKDQHASAITSAGFFSALCALAPAPALAEESTAASSGISALLQAVVNQADSAGPLGVLLFISTYAISCVFLIPASVLTLGAGAVYGPVVGTAVVSASSTTGCVLAFLASRYVVRPFAEKRLAQQPLFESLQKRIPERGAKLVLLLRLTPVVPFGLLNYACGLTTLPLGQYAAASWLGMLPGTAAYVLIGSAGKETLVAAGDGIPSFQLALYGLGAVAALLATREISKIAQESIGDLKEEG